MRSAVIIYHNGRNGQLNYEWSTYDILYSYMFEYDWIMNKNGIKIILWNNAWKLTLISL